MKEYVENMQEIGGKYVGNKNKYVALGIRRAKRGASRHIYLSPYIKALELLTPYIGLGSGT